MGATGYLGWLREHVGHALLVVPAAAACIRDEAGRVLLLQRGDGEDVWSFPGGVVEPGESVAEAVVREVHEETGLSVEPETLIGVYSGADYTYVYPNGDRVQPVISFFECRVVGGAFRPDMVEILGGRYVGPDEPLPPMPRCCVAKARDAFQFDGEAFFR